MSDMTDYFSAMGSKQRDQRVRRFFTDQHGRRFFAWADKDNQRPIGEFVLADESGKFVTPPWLPPMNQIKWRSEDSLQFDWGYAALADFLGSITADWYGEAQRIAPMIPGCAVPEVGGDVDPKLIGIMGGSPPLSPEIPIACEAGEPWLLGVRGAKENPRLAKILHLGKTVTSTLALDTIRERVRLMMEQQGAAAAPQADLSTVPDEKMSIGAVTVTYKDFLSAALKNGSTMADAAIAWKAHRENLELEAVA